MGPPTMGAPTPIPTPTSTFHLTVVLANIATSIPYRQYCFAHICAAAACFRESVNRFDHHLSASRPSLFGRAEVGHIQAP